MSMPTSHPVLLETTSTFLVRVRADTPAAARRAAQKNPGEFLGDLAACDGAQVDASTDAAAVTEDTAAWLDLDSDAYQRLDDYFAAADGAGVGAGRGAA